MGPVTPQVTAAPSPAHSFVTAREFVEASSWLAEVEKRAAGELGWLGEGPTLGPGVLIPTPTDFTVPATVLNTRENLVFTGVVKLLPV